MTSHHSSSGGYDDGDVDNGSSGSASVVKKKTSDGDKKYTAKITAKEREKDKAIAVAPNGKESNESGPDPIAISLFALAAVLAAVFYRWIRSDLRVIKWHEQKKALKRP